MVDEPSLPTPPQTSEESPRWRRGRVIFFAVGLGLFLAAFFYLGSAKRTVAIDNPVTRFLGIAPTPSPTAVITDPNYAMPTDDPNRLNVLILGMEGQDDANAAIGGPLLTDSIEVFSYDKTTHKASLVSIPRDLFVTIHDGDQDKLNTAYEYGYYHSSDSLQFVKDEISRITGIYIDNVVIFDFSSFKQIVDSVGGIDVTLTQPFSETEEWGYTFSLPAGTDHLDGQSALYYARSRYTTNDFDRSRRQQQIILALKTKLTSLNYLSDPVKTFNIINAIHNDIKTDISIWDINQFLQLAHNVNFNTMTKYVISTDNFVDQSTGPDGAYILLPKGGNLTGIKQLFQEILTNPPPNPSPTP